eukprot:8103546-Pyramimonas_sp.AAC.1
MPSITSPVKYSKRLTKTWPCTRRKKSAQIDRAASGVSMQNMYRVMQPVYKRTHTSASAVQNQDGVLTLSAQEPKQATADHFAALLEGRRMGMQALTFKDCSDNARAESTGLV